MPPQCETIWRMVSKSKWIGLLSVAACAALLASGCGGGGGGSDTTSPEDWANGVCKALTTWRDSIQSSAKELQSTPSKAGLQSFADNMSTATNDLVDDVKGLGKPDTEGGDKAKEATDTLSDQLDGDVDKIQSATKGVNGASEALTAASTVTATLATMGNQVTAAVSQLQAADVGNELEDAFSNAESCKALSSSS
jgi:hypothetical protein